MSAPIRSATPSTVSPVQWIRAFAYTPDPTPVRNAHHCLDQAVDDQESVEGDVLPTRFQPHARSRAVGGTINPDLTVPGRNSDAHVSGPVLTVPAKRKRRRGGSGVSSSVSNMDGFSATCRSASQQRTERTLGFATGCTSVIGGDVRSPCPSLSVSPSDPRSRRAILDAEIVRRKGSQPGRRRTAHKSASSHYPSPPVSRACRNIAVDDSAPHMVSPVMEHASSGESTSSLKVSKYFTPTSNPPTRHRLDIFPGLTPPTSPILTTAVHVESSDFEYPPPNVLLHDRAHVPSFRNTSTLFEDLMIMLRRLKPILIQESVRDDPWKVLIAVRLLNVTTGKAAIPVFCKNISQWPTPQDLVHASQDELVDLLRPLGLYNKRAKWLKDVSQRVLQDRQDSNSSGSLWDALLGEADMVTDAPHLRYPGVGPYALDSLRIFCTRDKEWMRVMPRDKELIRYLRWRWAVEEGKVWYPEGIGVIADVNVAYLVTLVDELATHYDDAIGGEGYMYHFCNDLCDMLGGNMEE